MHPFGTHASHLLRLALVSKGCNFIPSPHIYAEIPYVITYHIFPFLEHCGPSCLTQFPSGIGMQKNLEMRQRRTGNSDSIEEKNLFCWPEISSLFFSLPCQCQMKGRLLVIITPLNSQNRIEKLCKVVGSK